MPLQKLDDIRVVPGPARHDLERQQLRQGRHGQRVEVDRGDLGRIRKLLGRPRRGAFTFDADVEPDTELGVLESLRVTLPAWLGPESSVKGDGS